MYSLNQFDLHVDVDEYCDSPVKTDRDKGDYRIINGMCYPSDYMTAEEYALNLKVAKMDKFSKTYTTEGVCEDIAIIYFWSKTRDGKGEISEVQLSIGNKIIYSGKDFEKAEIIFKLLAVK